MGSVLPKEARAMLVSASSTDPRTPRGESKARAIALESALRHIRMKYPQYFQN